MSLLTSKFLYPNSRQFPFDEVAEKIVQELEKRNWNVPGISVKFYSYGAEEVKYKMVSCITGDNFKLKFSRVQGTVLQGTLNDIAGLSQIAIPKQILEVYGDYSPARYYLYVGKNWADDKNWFIDSKKIHSKLNNEPKRYLKYTCYGKRLEFDDDCGRDYSPEGKEPAYINCDRLFNKITIWLEKNVLEYILKFDETQLQEKLPKVIPYEGPWKTVYSVCTFQDVERIKKGIEDAKNLSLNERQVWFGRGYRLVPFPVDIDKKVPETVYKGFIWCDTDQKGKRCRYVYGLKMMDQVLLNMNSSLNLHDIYFIAINLKYANGVYVVENFEYDEWQKKSKKEALEDDEMINKEYHDVLVARGATLVPINEYRGNYQKPMVLISRKLKLEEIKWIRKID